MESRSGTKREDSVIPDQVTEVSVIESKRDQPTEISVIDAPRYRTGPRSDQITNVFAAEETSQPPSRLFGGTLTGGRLRDTEVVNIIDFEIVPGTTLGEYKIHGKLGEGGMGTVFSAIHPTIGKRAAIKVLKRQYCEDPVLVERFKEEARVVNQIGHPNIVDIFGFGEMPDGRMFLSMEWLQGETLRERLRRGPLSLTQMARLVRSLARALEAAHDNSVIHRDLKPENIFLADIAHEEPLVKLLDFGVAKLANDKGRMAQTEKGQILGTPMYIAPEQASNANDVSFASDVYSLGAIAFECLTGRPPFLARSTVEMVTAHITETPVAPSSLVPEVPDEIDRLVLEMLAKDPKDRPTLSHVRQLLEQVRDPAELFDQPTITTRSKQRPFAESKTDPLARPTPVPRDDGVEVRFSSGLHAPLSRPASEPPVAAAGPRTRERIYLIALVSLVVTLAALFATGIIQM